MALVEGRDWFRRHGVLWVRRGDVEHTLAKWAEILGIDDYLLRSRFHRATSEVDTAAKEYTLDDLFSSDYLTKRNVCPMLGLYFLAWLTAPEIESPDPKLFLEAISVVQDCGKKHYAKNVCRNCWRVLHEKPYKEDPEKARLRQRANARTEKGKKQRRNYQRRITIAQLILGGIVDRQELLDEIERRFSVVGDEAETLLELAFQLAKKKSQDQGS